MKRGPGPGWPIGSLLAISNPRRPLSPERLAAAVNADPDFYAELTAARSDLVVIQDRIATCYERIHQLTPTPGFPPTHFLVGDRGAGGLLRAEGVLLAVETAERGAGEAQPRFANTWLVRLAGHEMAHFLQVLAQGVDRYRAIYGPEGTLLELALREGAADYVVARACGGHINPAAHEYGRAHFQALRSEFAAERTRMGAGDWMFTTPQEPGRPADLGYFMGYAIAEAYVEQTGDPDAALADLLAAENPEFLFERSGLAEGE